MKILITGSNGFVGRNLKEFFAPRYEGVDCPRRQQLNLLDAEAVRRYVDAGQFDVVIHCGVTLQSVEENLKMYFNVERCAESFGRLICVGSGAEYDGAHYVPRMTEAYFGQHVPADIYGFSKYVMAKDIESRPRNLYNLRVFGIFGKYENHLRRFISNNICRVLCGLDISINRNTVFDYLYVDDFARLLEGFLRSTPRQRSYNTCRGEGIDLVSLAHIIRTVHGRDVPIVIRQEGMNPEYTGCNDRFTAEFGSFEYTPFTQAIEALYRWYRDDAPVTLDPAAFGATSTQAERAPNPETKSPAPQAARAANGAQLLAAR